MTFKYRSGYKYQLAESYGIATTIQPSANIVSEFIDLNTSGRLVVRKGYAWDGPSGPTVDTRNFMRGSLIHDALYQLMRGGKLNREEHRLAADNLLRDVCKADGMTSLRAWWVYRGVRMFGRAATTAGEKKAVVNPTRKRS